MLGHPNTNVVAATSKKYGFRFKEQQHVCQNCAIAKSKKKNAPKISRSLRERGSVLTFQASARTVLVKTKIGYSSKMSLQDIYRVNLSPRKSITSSYATLDLQDTERSKCQDQNDPIRYFGREYII
jgi:hypothetical protein